MRSATCTIVLLTYAFFSNAQVLSKTGRFAANYQTGCAPLTITLSELDDLGDISRQYIYEAGTPETSDLSHTYQQPGTYQIVQILGVDIDPKTDTLTVVVQDTQPVDFAITKCANRAISLTIQDDYYDSLIIDLQDSVVRISSGLTTLDYSYQSLGVKTIAVQGFFAEGPPNCQLSTQEVEITDFINNGTIDSIAISRTCLEIVEASLSMNLDSQQIYTLEYSSDGVNFTSATADVITSSLTTPPLPIDPTFNQICFRLQAFSPCDSEVATSDIFCQQLDSSTDSLAYATYRGSDIALFFNDLGSSNFMVERTIRGFDPEALGPVTSGFTDFDISPIREYEYSLSYQDSCGNQIPAFVLAPPHLILSETAPNEYLVDWVDPTNELASPDSTALVIYDAESAAIREIAEISRGSRLLLSEDQGRRQRVALRQRYTRTELDVFSNTITLQYDYRAYLPDAFTPDKDGLNDILRTYGLRATEVDFRVFNRWGEIIHRSTDPLNLWNGEINGESAIGGKYFYVLIFENIEGNNIQQQGSFVLIRN